MGGTSEYTYELNECSQVLCSFFSAKITYWEIVYTILCEKGKGRWQRGRLRHRWKDMINNDHTSTWCWESIPILNLDIIAVRYNFRRNGYAVPHSLTHRDKTHRDQTHRAGEMLVWTSNASQVLVRWWEAPRKATFTGARTVTPGWTPTATGPACTTVQLADSVTTVPAFASPIVGDQQNGSAITWSEVVDPLSSPQYLGVQKCLT